MLDVKWRMLDVFIARMCVHVCACVCVRVYVRACMRVCVRYVHNYVLFLQRIAMVLAIYFFVYSTISIYYLYVL